MNIKLMKEIAETSAKLLQLLQEYKQDNGYDGGIEIPHDWTEINQYMQLEDNLNKINAIKQKMYVEQSIDNWNHL